MQSGKLQITGLISRAADSGYNVIVVLAGLHNNLRKQTQIRLEELMGIDTEGLHVNNLRARIVSNNDTGR